MRKKFNRVAIASSSNYSSSRKAHIAYLEEQHITNSPVLLAIASRPVSKLTQFELGVAKQIAAYKERKAI